MTRPRTIPVDRARLHFDPATGRSIREESDATARLRLGAPRVALVGLTDHCDLRCTFCSSAHDTVRWDEDELFGLLAGLAEAGTLEVAFGGGEPLLYPPFLSLVRRLRGHTALAVHCTTNGRALTPELARALRPLLGELRLSLHRPDWPDTVDLLAREGLRFGVNHLLTPATLPGLSSDLLELAERACRDVLLLCYLGPDPRHHLSPEQTREAEQQVDAFRQLFGGRVRLALSSCWGARMACVPQIARGQVVWAGTDCGAGRDFVSIGPDGALRPCSFHTSSGPVTTAREVLERWSARPGSWSEPAPARGCARALRTGRPDDD